MLKNLLRLSVLPIVLVIVSISIDIYAGKLSLLNSEPQNNIQPLISPFMTEIQKLLEKGNSGLSLEESARLSDLINKNNEWHKASIVGKVAVTQEALVRKFEKDRMIFGLIVFLIWLLSGFSVPHADRWVFYVVGVVGAMGAVLTGIISIFISVTIVLALCFTLFLSYITNTGRTSERE